MNVLSIEFTLKEWWHICLLYSLQTYIGRIVRLVEQPMDLVRLILSLQIFANKFNLSILDKYPVSKRRLFDVHTTSITSKQRRTDVKTTSCAYWVDSVLLQGRACSEFFFHQFPVRVSTNFIPNFPDFFGHDHEKQSMNCTI